MASPTLLLTRPAASSQAFAASLDPEALAQVSLVISPLMEITGTGVMPSLTDMRGVIFTSANGVLFAPDGAGRPAYCVGAQTTRQAILRGWDARQAGDTADDLVAALDKNTANIPLLHLSGAHTRGDIARRLTAAGTPTDCEVVYDQKLLPLEPEAQDALCGPCIVPVFSPRSAEQLVREAQGKLGRAHIVALSNSVAGPLIGEKTTQLIVLPAPQAVYMRKAVENLCKILSLPREA